MTEEGFLVVLSGGVGGEREFAGVGTIVAPWARRYVIGFSEFPDRIMSMKIRITGGQLGIVCAHVVQGGRDFTDRHSFFDVLSDYLHRLKCHGPKLVVGDVNARLHRVRPGGEEMLDPYVFGHPSSAENPLVNRSLLLQLCVRHRMRVMNTIFAHSAERRVTYREWGVDVMNTDVSYRNFAQLDLFLLDEKYVSYVTDVFSDRSIGLNSSHF